MGRDLEMDRNTPIAQVLEFRKGIRTHRDVTAQDRCWHHSDRLSSLPEKTKPSIAVPPWPTRGCVRYRQSLHRRALGAPIHDQEFDG